MQTFLSTIGIRINYQGGRVSLEDRTDAKKAGPVSGASDIGAVRSFSFPTVFRNLDGEGATQDNGRFIDAVMFIT